MEDFVVRVLDWEESAAVGTRSVDPPLLKGSSGGRCSWRGRAVGLLRRSPWLLDVSLETRGRAIWGVNDRPLLPMELLDATWSGLHSLVAGSGGCCCCCWAVVMLAMLMLSLMLRWRTGARNSSMLKNQFKKKKRKNNA